LVVLWTAFAKDRMSLQTKPLSPGTWTQFEELFGRQQGGRSGCWCKWWRLSRSGWERLTREERRVAFKSVVDGGSPTGVMLFDGDAAVGWCAVSPRGDLPSLARSAVAKPIDATPTWCISCFFIKAGHRRQGHMERLIRGAVDFAGRNGAEIVEAFPQETAGRTGYIDAFVGIASCFRRCGFHDIEPRGRWRRAMRCFVR
jgi:hypothetical protein